MPPDMTSVKAGGQFTVSLNSNTNRIYMFEGVSGVGHEGQIALRVPRVDRLAAQFHHQTSGRRLRTRDNKERSRKDVWLGHPEHVQTWAKSRRGVGNFERWDKTGSGQRYPDSELVHPVHLLRGAP